MRFVAGLAVLLLVPPILAGSTEAIDEEFVRMAGPLPDGGRLDDVLVCTGAAEIQWLFLRDFGEAAQHEITAAQRKASWYSAVALHIFAVESQAIHDAISAAREQPLPDAIALSKNCRDAPSDWQELHQWSDSQISIASVARDGPGVWILIAWFAGGVNARPLAVEFNSEDACEAAGKQLAAAADAPNNEEASSASVGYACVAKD